MASAAAEAEKGSPIVVGMLVVGNIIILVRHPPVLGTEWEGGGRRPVLSLGWRAKVQDSPADQCYRLSG